MTRLLYLVLVASASCMETRETVERMVMVRRTGSDLQPAASGFIYKKDNDGPAEVVKMGESEIMEQLKTIYKQPVAFAAPLPVAAGPFYAKQQDEAKAESHASEAYAIPAAETDDASDEAVDGIVNDDYGNIFAEYAGDFNDYKGDYSDFADFDHYNSDFGDYLHGLGHGYGHHDHGHEDGSEYGGDKFAAHGDKGSIGYAKNNKFSKGGAGDYHNENHESFSVSSGGGEKKVYGEADAYGSDYAQGHGYTGDDHGHKSEHSKGEETDGYHKLFDKDEFKKDHGFYDGEGNEGSFHKFGGGHKYYGSDAGGHEEGGSHDSGAHEEGFGEDGYLEQGLDSEHDAGFDGEAAEESDDHHESGFASNFGLHNGKGFSFEIKHR